jgi:hypothetical protein
MVVHGRNPMPDTQIDQIIESLRSMEASTAGREALAAPRRGDYDWGDEPPTAGSTVEGEQR